MTDCLFCRIVRGEIPASRVAETEECVAFRDIAPQAPVHVLIIPRKHFRSLDDVTDAFWGLGYGMTTLPEVTLQLDDVRRGPPPGLVRQARARGRRRARHVLESHHEAGATGEVSVDRFGLRAGALSVLGLLRFVYFGPSVVERFRSTAARSALTPVLAVVTLIEFLSARAVIRRNGSTPAHRVRRRFPYPRQ